ncbi:MAG TPA: metal ABC transporter ATP-binding protein, partial [Anaerolineales bacterium]|nr:metal ABC transporter ATP-binding protein [Anaerolineales bacterium]
DVVMMGRIGKLGLFRWPQTRDWEIVHQALDLVGLGRLSKRQISELSGGQQQRMFIARALAQEAELMLMDEPFTGLDIISQQEILNIINELQRRSVTILASTHDLQLAQDSFDRILLLNRQMIGFGPPAEVLAAPQLLEAYGGHLRLVNDGGTLLALGDTCCDGEEPHD